MLVLTHYHADHTGGAAELIRRFRPRLVLVRAGAPPAWLARVVAAADGELRSAVPGESLVIGGATWQTLSVPDGGGLVVQETGEGEAENDASVVGVGASGGVRVLLAGDAEPAGQRRALRTVEDDRFRAEILKLPHHGSSRQEPRFFAATGATLAVASAGKDNDYGHPAQAAIDLAEGLGMRLARTDLQGTIAVTRTEQGTLSVRTER